MIESADRARCILVADDRPASRELMRTILERFGFRVLEASDGLEAVEVVRRTLPDLVLLDIQMPGLDGFGVVHALRADGPHTELPIVAVTAAAMRGDREKAMAAGFSGYLAKPVSASALRAEIARLLRD